MLEYFHSFCATDGRLSVVALPFQLDEMLSSWDGLARAMVASGPPEQFSREEWAYLISFIDARSLTNIFTATFGLAGLKSDDNQTCSLFRPLERAVLWVPNNISLLGPLAVILLLTAGLHVRVKVGSRSIDMVTALSDYVLTPGHTFGPLRNAFVNNLEVAGFGHDDPRHHEWSANADIRIVFGGNTSIAAIEALPHAPASRMFAFADHRSEAWVEFDLLNDATLEMILRVFGIYGQGGCTSPRRIVLVDGNKTQADFVANRLLELWEDHIVRDAPLHTASETLMVSQVAAANGWHVHRAANNGAVFLSGAADCPEPIGRMSLPVVALSLAKAIEQLPMNIQTIGYIVANPRDAKWLSVLANTKIKRFVPLAKMHNFGPVWDGIAFWRQCFEQVELS